jgi:ATP-dependent DNA helicase DinG
VLQLRQGFGRLIRTHRDRGVVAILDPRVRTRRYGRTFLESLPPCRVVSDRGELARFLSGEVTTAAW